MPLGVSRSDLLGMTMLGRPAREAWRFESKPEKSRSAGGLLPLNICITGVADALLTVNIRHDNVCHIELQS